MSTPVHPDCSTIRCTRSRFANANCPGASGRRGGNSGSSGAAARSAAVMNGFSAGLRQAMKRISAPGAAARRRLAKARTGSSKNMTPKREVIRSKDAGSNAKSCASAQMNFAATFALAARARATSIIGAEMSMPVPRPFAPMRRAAASVVAPVPQPTSSTRVAERAASACSSSKGRNRRSSNSWPSIQAWPAEPFHNSAWLTGTAFIESLRQCPQGRRLQSATSSRLEVKSFQRVAESRHVLRAFQHLEVRALEVVADRLVTPAQALAQEPFRDRIERSAVGRAPEAVALFRIQHVGHGQVLVLHRLHDLIRLGLLDARIIRALRDQQRLLDVRDEGERRTLEQHLAAVFGARITDARDEVLEELFPVRRDRAHERDDVGRADDVDAAGEGVRRHRDT